MSEKFSLIPFVRAPLNVGTNLVNTRRSMHLQLQLRADGREVDGTFAQEAVLRGPGDVIGIDRAQIARVEPSARLAVTEPNYFPFVEFVDPDFPWRYTLDEGSANRLKPWIVLLALKATEFEFLPQGLAPAPSIRVFKPEGDQSLPLPLPELSQSWAFAHAHVSLLPNEGSASTLTTDPSRGFSRLLCPRKLEERTNYWLFLVPTWKVGVEAGLGNRLDDSMAAQGAWDTDDKEVVLPFYFKSQFNTDAGEDFESLLSRLRPPTTAEKAAFSASSGLNVPCANPGYYEGYAKPGKTFEQQCALEFVGRTEPSFETDDELVKRLVPTLNGSIQGNLVEEDGPDPLVTLPAYGFRFPPATALNAKKAKKNQSWFDRLNLDIKFRHVASLGTEVVAKNQERYSKQAWDQYEDLGGSNRSLVRLEVAAKLAAVLTEKHFAKLQPVLGLALAQPLHPYVQMAGKGTIQQLMRDAGVPGCTISRGLLKLASKRLIQQNVRAPQQFFPAPPGMAVSTVRSHVTVGPTIVGVRVAKHAELKNKLRPLLKPAGVAAIPAFSSVKLIQLRVEPIKLKEMHQQVVKTLSRLPAAKADFVVSGRSEAEKKSGGPVARSPVINDPLANDLKKIFPERMASFLSNDGSQNQSSLPNNTVVLLQENRAFIEAFMAGANHAMQEELRWREFPTNMRETIFRRFWPSTLPDDRPEGDSIRDVHTWTKGLGGNGTSQPRLVIGLRGDLVRKYHHLQVVINIAEPGKEWDENKGDTYSAEFAGTLGPDFAYHGFGITLEDIKKFASNSRKAFAVFYEPMGHLRFGLDVGNTNARERARDLTRISLAFPISAAGNAKSTAKRPKGGTTPNKTWADLSTGDVQMFSTGYVDFEHTLDAREGIDLWGAKRSSASLARSLWQKPIAGFVPLVSLFPGL
jgi:hypothetical protein